ncbi:MAG TPA: hypothetical protein VNK41_02655 [Vicinamibacterales bacterium]|nr:hypothetical protein [Vicinamibacterales bacterium]
MTRIRCTVPCAALLLLMSTVVRAQAPAATSTPTVDELIRKNIDARGGEERLQSIDTRRVTGTISIGDRQAKLRVLAKRPNLMLQEMLDGDQRFVTAFDGQQAWAVNPMLGGTPQRIDGPPGEALRAQAQFDGPLIGAYRRGDRIEVVGPELVDGVLTWKLAVHTGDRVVHVYLDQQTGLERKVSAAIAGEAGDLLIESVFSDFETVEGLTMPRRVETRVGGELQATVQLQSVEFNVPLDDSEFKMPSASTP